MGRPPPAQPCSHMLRYILGWRDVISIEDKAMKAFLLAGLTILSITSANAAPKAAIAQYSAVASNSVSCSVSVGGFGTYPSGCQNAAHFKTYNECKESGVKRGWSHQDMAWYCSGLGLQ